MPAVTTRRRFKTLADAAQDRRVRYADAETAYARAIAKAVDDRAAARKRADAQWDAISARVRAGACQRRALRVMYRGMGDEELVDLYNRSVYMLTDDYAPFRDVALEESTTMAVRAMRPVIDERGLVV